MEFKFQKVNIALIKRAAIAMAYPRANHRAAGQDVELKLILRLVILQPAFQLKISRGCTRVHGLD